eukprot:TRINITY_DN30178_c0_g1_i1.p1 TRINITY_DN30178_c0_g1~~TRINITY_DN30178_c0_g1_i1.p1  ORF type:complete len:685 (+),score=133.21 TRINITY_DN30178_c0_g1_i1:66-2120(+)
MLRPLRLHKLCRQVAGSGSTQTWQTQPGGRVLARRFVRTDPATLVKDLGARLDNDPELADQVSGLFDAKKLAQVMKDRGSHLVDPTIEQLRRVALVASIPFFCFGLLDNAVMIFFGEIIDTTLCVKFGFSTMAAAALGNTFSDVIGVYSGGTVEWLAAKYGFDAPPLTRAQESLASVRKYRIRGQVVGIVIGCLAGMFPLLLIDAEKAEKLKRERELDDLFTTVVDNVARVLQADDAVLMFMDESTQELYTRSTKPDSHLKSFRSPASAGIMGTVATTGKFLNIEDLPNTEYYVPERHANYHGTGVQAISVLCMPVIGVDEQTEEKKILGVLEVINKRGQPGFTDRDEDALAMICSHIATTISTVSGSQAGFQHAIDSVERTLAIRGRRLNPAQDKRVEMIYEQVMNDVSKILHASATTLFVTDDQTGEFMVKVSDRIPFVRQKAHKGVMGKAAHQQQSIVVNNLRNSAYYDPDLHDDYGGAGIVARAVLAAPVIATDGEVLAVLEVVKAEGGDTLFTADDVRFLNSVASSIALNLEGAGASLTRILQVMEKQHSREVAMGLRENDCSSELLAITEAALALIEKAGGQVKGPVVSQETGNMLDMHCARRKRHISDAFVATFDAECRANAEAGAASASSVTAAPASHVQPQLSRPRPRPLSQVSKQPSAATSSQTSSGRLPVPDS